MSSAYIRGMRGNDPFYLRCGATLKHFYANNVEHDRISISSSLDGRNKYEYYLEPFRKAIAEGGAEAVMTSYNEINGVPAIVNEEVQKILKDTWGLPGHVVCDGGDMQQTVYDHKYFRTHAETVAYGLKAGVDCFTDDKEVVMASAWEALEKGMITEADIDRSIRNSFRTRIRLGFFDGNGDCPCLLYTSNTGTSYTTLSRELEHVNVYLDIQKLRFTGKFDGITEIGGGVDPEQLYILPLLLQPIVENAILHGLEEKEQGGIIKISVTKQRKEEELLCIEVSDNGSGMTEEELEQLRKNIGQKDMTRSKSIGLYNINQRIKLTYGSTYGIQVLSVPGEGTRVCLYLPVSRMNIQNSPADCI